MILSGTNIHGPERTIEGLSVTLTDMRKLTASEKKAIKEVTLHFHINRINIMIIYSSRKGKLLNHSLTLL